MTHNTASPGDLTFWSFVDYAVQKAEEELPSVNTDAMRMVLTLNRATSMVIYDLESTVHRPRGLTWPGFRVIFALWLAGPMEAKTTAEISGTSRAALSALLNTLERDGLVVRERATHDRRALQLSLTEAGYRAILGAFAHTIAARVPGPRRSNPLSARNWSVCSTNSWPVPPTPRPNSAAEHAEGPFLRIVP